MELAEQVAESHKEGSYKMSGQEIDYRHFRTLTDKTRIIQFAIKNRPDINSGHTADDNARALLVALNMKGEERLYYTRLFTNFLWSAQWLDGSWSTSSCISVLFPPWIRKTAWVEPLWPAV